VNSLISNLLGLPPSILAFCWPGLEIMLMLQKFQKNRLSAIFFGSVCCPVAEGLCANSSAVMTVLLSLGHGEEGIADARE
jgi:hypothetical protein